MKKLKKIFLFLALGSLILPLLNSCHKYPEDPFISLKRSQVRLRGTWKVTSYQINGVEHGHDFDTLLSTCTIYECTISFEAGTKSQKWGEPVLRTKSGFDIFGGDRQYDLLSRTLRITANDFSFNIAFWKLPNKAPLASYAEWTIEELYNKKMHLKLGNTDIYFKKE